MQNLLTPRRLADAIGVSESSLRRWVDDGKIQMARTAGGHRRIALADAVRFIRSARMQVVRPELLGLTQTPVGREGAHALPDALYRALHNGEDAVARGLVISAFLSGESMAELFDGPMRTALARIGDLWRHDPRGILIEHRAVDICIGIINQLRTLVTTAETSGPVALGGSPAGDPYMVPSLMACAVLAEAGFRAINFGPDTPVELLAGAAEEHNASVVWLAIGVEPAAGLKDRLGDLAARLVRRPASLVLGGRGAREVIPPERPNVQHVQSMRDLSLFGRGVAAACR